MDKNCDASAFLPTFLTEQNAAFFTFNISLLQAYVKCRKRCLHRNIIHLVKQNYTKKLLYFHNPLLIYFGKQ